MRDGAFDLRLAGQRFGSRLPGPLRAVLRRAARLLPGADPQSALEPWNFALPEPLEWSALSGDEAHPAQPSGARSDRKCLLVSSGLDAGGMDEVVGFLARSLPATGFSVAVAFTPDHQAQTIGRLGHALIEIGVEVVDLRGSELLEWIQTWRPDVASAHGVPSWALDILVDAHVPVVETLHGMHTMFNVDELSAAARRARLARLVAVSEMVREQYLQIDSECPPEMVVTIPNGVDTDRLQLPTRAVAREALGIGDEFLFVSLSRHSLQKNTYGLVAAFQASAAAHDGARLIVTGRPDDPEYLRQVARLRDRGPARDRIHLRDHFPYPGLLLTAADCFILDSFFEGWALASMEALAVGVPTILSDVGGAREQVAAVSGAAILVDNPLGDPLDVDWGSISRARFSRQSNLEQLVEAIDKTAGRRVTAEERAAFSSVATSAFSPVECVRRHARVLHDVAKSRD